MHITAEEKGKKIGTLNVLYKKLLVNYVGRNFERKGIKLRVVIPYFRNECGRGQITY
jgi:hypothetical protein